MTVRLDLEQFISSMPSRYTETFDAAAIEQHARTSRARGERPVNVGLFTSASPTGTALCVVAPDRPGLLAIISLAFATCDLDIIAADVFTRQPSEASAEAVDFFWVRRQPPYAKVPLQPADIRKIRDVLIDLLQRAPKELFPVEHFSTQTPASTGTVVRFLEDIKGRFATLEIESNDQSGLLLGVCQALFNEGIQIVGSRIKTRAGRVTGRFEIVELSDRPIERERRRIIKLAVLSAVDSLSKDAISLMVG
jgi:[protein-PII] uridylyltransferase